LLLLDATVAGGAGWITGSTSFKYRSTSASGITRIVIQSIKSVPGQLRFTIRGKGLTLSTTPLLPLRATLVLDPPVASTGQCGDALFPGPAPLPHCTATSNRIVCR